LGGWPQNRQPPHLKIQFRSSQEVKNKKSPLGFFYLKSS